MDSLPASPAKVARQIACCAKAVIACLESLFIIANIRHLGQWGGS